MSEFKKKAKTLYDIQNDLPEIPLNERTEEKIKARMDAEYKTLYVPLEVVESAKKEFLETIIYLPRGTSEEKIENLLNERKLRKEWFKKWFMDSADEAKVAEK